MKIYRVAIECIDESNNVCPCWSKYCTPSALAAAMELMMTEAAAIAPIDQWANTGYGHTLSITDSYGTIKYRTGIYTLEVME